MRLFAAKNSDSEPPTQFSREEAQKGAKKAKPRRRRIACCGYELAGLARGGGSSGMVKITGEYQGELHCSAAHGPSGQVLFTDAPKDNQGKGEAFSPTDLTATSLATCIATTMAIAARKQGVELNGLRFEVTKEMSTDAPRRIVRLATTLWLPVRRDVLPEGFLERVAANCPVHHSLHPDVAKPVTFIWPE